MTKLSTEKVRLSVINAAVGAITEGDVNLAIASQGHHRRLQRAPGRARPRALAEENKIEIRLYSIIYNALEDVKGAMEGLLPPTLVEKQHGKAEVRADLQGQGRRRRRLLRDRGQDRPRSARCASCATAR